MSLVGRGLCQEQYGSRSYACRHCVRSPLRGGTLVIRLTPWEATDTSCRARAAPSLMGASTNGGATIAAIHLCSVEQTCA